jgi:hypothetical protein
MFDLGPFRGFLQPVISVHSLHTFPTLSAVICVYLWHKKTAPGNTQPFRISHNNLTVSVLNSLKKKALHRKTVVFTLFPATNKGPSCFSSATSTENITVSFSSNRIHAKTAPNEKD